MKTIVYKPKHKDDVQAAVAIGKVYGYNYDFQFWSEVDGWSRAAKNGLVLAPLTKEMTYGSGPATALQVDSLDALLTALTAKPEKQPKELGTFTLEVYNTETSLSPSPHKVSLLPDGAVRVGCHRVSSDDFQRIWIERERYLSPGGGMADLSYPGGQQ